MNFSVLIHPLRVEGIHNIKKTLILSFCVNQEFSDVFPSIKNMTTSIR